MEKFGEEFLHKKDSRLHISKPVDHEVERKKRRGERVSQKPSDKLSDWMEVLQETHMGHKEDPRVFERIKDHYKNEYVTITLEDIPQGYWNNKAEVMIHQGYGGDMTESGVEKQEYTNEKGETYANYFFPEEQKEKELEVVRLNQERSLDKWVDYLISDDAKYPMWAKYWAFTSMLKMGKFEKIEEEENGEKTEKSRFQKRTKSTTASFPLLNPRALAKTIGVMSQHLREKERVREEKQKPKTEQNPNLLTLNIKNESSKLNDEEFQKLLSAEKFANLYAQFLIEVPEYSTKGLREIRGEWKKFARGSEPDELVKSLEGHPLEWCTADPNTAKTQLDGGDFHVYYSYDENGDPVIPRLAIRMEGEKIAEARGIAPDQNIDPYILPVLEEKLDGFGKKGDIYKKRVADMEKLLHIHEKNNNKEELTKEDLHFLYEIDKKIEGFGYKKDPRIEEILNGRNVKEDLSIVLNCSSDQISTTKEEFLEHTNIIFHYGDLELQGTQIKELPDNLSVGGGLNFQGTQIKELPDNLSVGEYLNLRGTQIKELPDNFSVGGSLSLEETPIKELPDNLSVGSYLNLQGTPIKELPDNLSVGEDLDLQGTQIKELPDNLSVGEYLNLQGTPIKELPDNFSVGGGLNLRGTQIKELPENIKDLVKGEVYF